MSLECTTNLGCDAFVSTPADELVIGGLIPKVFGERAARMIGFDAAAFRANVIFFGAETLVGVFPNRVTLGALVLVLLIGDVVIHHSSPLGWCWSLCP